ncbi:MAG: hypothetical protein HY841_03735 [Bacteroidetes bacterium]|nr:hypothetical protein [Bacteroidota bacterium]
MKTKKFLSATALIVFAVCSMGAKRLQCGVSEDQIRSYLQNCSHHHTTYWFRDIPGTCNSEVGIENCKIATVYVSGGTIITHLDSPTVCGE